MQQNVDKIASLESCKSLENVWIAETQVDKIQGLENNLNLKNLYLYSNKIKRIENLSHLTKLERIWLCDNEIPRIEGLERLSSLTELNIARNKVERVGDIFKMNPKLTSLNLSDNGIGSFKEVSYLARLPSLTDLSLSDPHWGENPITSLCNYQVRVVCLRVRVCARCEFRVK
jgi:Leucine-rich repeat (LRR) protein